MLTERFSLQALYFSIQKWPKKNKTKKKPINLVSGGEDLLFSIFTVTLHVAGPQSVFGLIFLLSAQFLNLCS